MILFDWREGSHLLVCGSAGSGRTTLARAVAADRAGAGWGVIVVTDRPDGWRPPGVSVVTGAGGARLSADDLAFGWRSRSVPTLVVVDDPPGLLAGASPSVLADLVATPGVCLLLVVRHGACDVVPLDVVEASARLWLGAAPGRAACRRLFGVEPGQLPLLGAGPGRGVIQIGDGCVVRPFVSNVADGPAGLAQHPVGSLAATNTP